MKKYKVIHAPVMSFYSTNFYRDVGFYWKGTGFAYLILLLIICWIPNFIKYQIFISNYIKNKAPIIISQIPEIQIISGETHVDVTQPYKIIDPDSKDVMVVIDTTGQSDSLKKAFARVTLTRTELFLKKNDIETRSFSLKKIGQLFIDQPKVTYWVAAFLKYSAIVFYPFAVIGSFLFRIVQLLIYATIGLLFAKWVETDQSFLTLLRLSVIAITPVIIINTGISVADIKIPMHSLLNFIFAMAYLYMGVKAVSSQGGTQINQVDSL